MLGPLLPPIIDLEAYREAQAFHRLLTRTNPNTPLAPIYRQFADLWGALSPPERVLRLQRLSEQRRVAAARNAVKHVEATKLTQAAKVLRPDFRSH